MTAPHPSHHRTLSMVSTLSSGEDLFSSIPGFDEYGGGGPDDDLDCDLIGDGADDNDLDSKDSLLGASMIDGDGKGGARKLKRPASTAEKKATHNAVERARRESLNGRFLVLADMLPGMTHVKRASKAAIVNKSIELIRELQATETRVSKENDALKAELATLRAAAAATSAASSTAPNNGMNSPANNVNAAAAAAAVAAMYGQGMPPMPMMPLLPNMMGGYPHPHPHHQNQGIPGLPPTPASPAHSLPSVANPNASFHQQMQEHLLAQHLHHQAQQHHLLQQQQQQQQEHQQQRASSATPFFPGVFNGLFGGPMVGGGVMESLENVRSESGSPASGSGNVNASYFAAAAAANGGYYDLTSAFAGQGNTAAPPPLGHGHGLGHGSPHSPVSPVSPAGTHASFQSVVGKDVGGAGVNSTLASASGSGSGSSAPPTTASSSGNNTAPSPASSHSVPTPMTNPYSPPMALADPSSLVNNHAKPSSALDSPPSSAPAPTAVQHYEPSADAAALLAAHHYASAGAPSSLEFAKAQLELQSFIAYQQRIAAGQNSPSSPQPYSPSSATHMQNTQHGNPFAAALRLGQSPFPSSANGAGNGSGGAGPENGLNIPAWQMMMAQQHALTTAFGGGGQGLF